MNLLAHPFRFGPDGKVATVEDGSDLHISQHVHLIVGTKLGERSMCWTYGITNPAWAQVDGHDVQTCLDLHGPEGVTITSVTTVAVDEQTSAVDLRWGHDNDEDVTQ